MLTFEALFEILRKEKMNPELQKLDEDFYNQTIKYLEEKSAILETEKKTDSIFSGDSKRTQLQLENAKKIIKEIYEKRENKIINLAMLSSRAEVKESGHSMLQEEKKLFKEVLEVLDSFRGGILHNMLNSQKVSVRKNGTPKDIKTIQSQPSESKMVRFLNAVPKFVADDLNVYGPFEQEDMCFLPNRTANLLLKRKRVEEIQVENTKNQENLL